MNYRYSILNEPFKVLVTLGEKKEEIIKTERSVRVNYFDKDGNPDKEVVYGYIDSTEIMGKIEKHEPIILNDCFVKDISFRRIQIDSFQAKGALFHQNIDFGDAIFNSETSFRNTIFNCEVDFRRTRFNGKVDFGETVFNYKVDFSRASFFNKADIYNANFYSNTEFRETIFHNEVNFKGTMFSNKVTFQEALFKNQVFFTEVMFNNIVDFTATVFNKRALFLYAIFYGKASLRNAVYNDFASFYSTTFRDEVVFRRAKFYGGSHFGIATFHGNVDFHFTEFTDGAYFRDAKFNGNVEFYGSRFDKDANFIHCEFVNYGSFVYSTFNGDTSFAYVNVNTSIDFSYTKFSSLIELAFKKCEKLILNNCVFEKSCDISSEIKFSQLSIKRCKCFGLLSIPFSEDLISAIQNYSTSDVNKGNSRVDNIELAQELNFLKICYNRNGEYDFEDLAYVEYKRCLRKTKNTLWQMVEWLCLDVASCYCTKPRRVLYVVMLAILVFTGLFYITMLLPCIPDAVSYGDNYKGLWGCFYHSLVTFFTIGFGDSQPQGIFGLIITGLEGFAGVFLMSLFTVSFAHKVLR